MIAIDGLGLGFVGPAMAEALLATDRAEVKQTKRMKIAAGERAKFVVAIKLTQAGVQVSDLGLRPGSYGITEVHSEYGVYFEHRPTYETAITGTPRRKAA